MNPRISDIAPSLIRSINARKRPGDIDMGLGEPTLPPDLAAFEAALEWTRDHGSPYSPNAGFPELREAIAAYLGRSGWVEGAPSTQNVCVTVGSEEALYLAIKTAIDPEVDDVVIVEPCYLAYAKICVLEGIRYRMIPLSGDDGFAPNADAVLAAIGPRTRLVILNTPSNPTGRVWPHAELEKLAKGLTDRDRDVYVLADEVYRELYYSADPPGSIASHHPNTLVAGSLSKSNALTGLRVGWLAGPPGIIEQAIKVHQFVNTAATTFAQRVALHLLSDHSKLAAHRPLYAAARRRLLDAARRYDVALIPPEGAFYAFVRLPGEGMDSLAMAERLLDEQRVVSVPGRAFGVSGEGWLRLSWVAPADQIELSIQRIAACLDDGGPGR